MPDQLTLDGAEIGSLLEHVGALREARVDVHWPRALGRDLTTRAVLERRADPRDPELPLQDSPFAVEGLFSFSWQVALHGETLTDEEMEQLARSRLARPGCAAPGPSSTRRPPSGPASG